MNNQGRLINAIVILMVSMTTGALVLLSLEGKPLTPVAFSLSSSNEISTNLSRETLGTRSGINTDQWSFIEISFSSSYGEILNKSTVGELDLKNHFVICDGSNDNTDGHIIPTSKWYNQKQVDGPLAKNVIKICLLSENGKYKPTPWQYNRLESLVNRLAKHCNIPLNHISTVK